MGSFKRLTATALLAAAALAQQAYAQQTIKVGSINPYSGPMALYGTEVGRGYELAVERINAAGGVLGRKIDLVRGDAATPQQGIATVEQLATKDKVDMFVGTYASAVSNATSDAAARYNKLYWETNALAADLTDRGLPNFVRASPSSAHFSAGTVDTVRDLIAPALKKDLKDIKVWIEHEDSIYGSSIAKEQKRLFDLAGVKVVGMGSHSSKSIDLNDTVLRAKQTNPDVLIQTGYVPDGNLLLRTARDQGFKPPAMLWVGTGDTAETLESLGAASIEGLLIVGYTRIDVPESFGPGAKAYLEAYRAKYKMEPIALQGLAAYVGMQMLFEAIQSAGSTDLDKVRAAAAKMDKPVGTYANGYGTKFDQNFQNQRVFTTTMQWQGGKLYSVYPKAAVSPGVTLKSLARN
ncbi:MAG: ABC transporter substrate-binding protein [Burkholderiaceae bacterium]